MSVKSKYFLTVLLLVFLALIPSGCFFCGWKQIFCFDVTYSLTTGQEFNLFSQKADRLFVANGGNINFFGQINPPVPPVNTPARSGSNAVASIPSRLDIILRHLDANGTQIEKRTYKVRVDHTTGKIRKQKFIFNQMSIDANEVVQVSVKPKGDLSQSSLNFTVEYIKQ